MTEVKDKKVEIKETPNDSEAEIKTEEKPEEEGTKKELLVRKYRPLSTFGAIDRLFSDMNHWFDDLFWTPSRPWDYQPFSLKVFDEDPFFRTPLSNISDDGDAFSITAELPGLDKGDLEITIHDGTLEIKGEKKEEHEEKDKGYVRKEYHSSSYYRTFAIPEGIDEEKIDATLDKGVLKLHLPKKEEEKKETKKIEVK